MTGLTSGMALVGGASQGTGRVVAAGGAETAMTEALTAGQREKLLASGGIAALGVGASTSRSRLSSRLGSKMNPPGMVMSMM